MKKINALRAIVKDETLPREVRLKAARDLKHKTLNPIPEAEFDPKTFEPRISDPMVQLLPRSRKDPPRRLPTKGLKPKEVMEGQMVGMFESKQDLYLMMAHYINDLLDRVEELEQQVKGTKKT